MIRLTGLRTAKAPRNPDTPAEAAPTTAARSPLPIQPISTTGMPMSTKPAAPPQMPFRTEIPRRLPDLPGNQRKPMDGIGPEGKKLVVGRDIRLNGAISSCDCLVVEGTVEANLSGTRNIVVAKGGTFTGVANVATAEISGLFDGELAASDTVTVRPGGIVRGTIAYVNLVSERGAVIEGTLTAVSRKTEPTRTVVGHPKTSDAVG